ncbi:MAG: tRNA 2-thiouridine(34) synthase MnmA [Phycisphaerales bacterium]|nr:tRNA 2-thiouridine(34) synthase MnmA [Phycisphaerales bacterium]
MTAAKPKVLLAMSGGVDSSVAAALLLRAGYEVVGVFMRLGSPGETIDQLTPDDSTGGERGGGTCDPAKVKIGHQGCCSINDADDARQVAAALDIPFYVVNFKKDFNRIIDYFVDEYAAGRTPNPCVRCNDWLKFGKLHDYAKQIGAEFVASGHYARAEGGRLMRGLDTDKDQSYVLFGVPREQLSRMLLPIGTYKKSVVRDMARELGLPVFDKPDSQEICFVPDNNYAGLVERRRPDTVRPGVIEDEQGNEIGTHTGHHNFTIGQRRGIGVALGYPIYVVNKDPATNRVTVATEDALMCNQCVVSEANWLTDPIPPSPAAIGGGGGGVVRSTTEGVSLPVLIQYRAHGEVVPATLRLLDDSTTPTPSGRTGRFHIFFDAPQRAVAPGQALVVYDAHQPDTVLGGGWIESVA